MDDDDPDDPDFDSPRKEHLEDEDEDRDDGDRTKPDDADIDRNSEPDFSADLSDAHFLTSDYTRSLQELGDRFVDWGGEDVLEKSTGSVDGGRDYLDRHLVLYEEDGEQELQLGFEREKTGELSDGFSSFKAFIGLFTGETELSDEASKQLTEILSVMAPHPGDDLEKDARLPGAGDALTNIADWISKYLVGETPGEMRDRQNAEFELARQALETQHREMGRWVNAHSRWWVDTENQGTPPRLNMP